MRGRRELLTGLAAAAVLLPIGALAVPSVRVRGDLEARFLRMVRQLDEVQRAALLRFMQRIVNKAMPMRDAAALYYRECGMQEAEARQQAADVLREYRA